MPWWKRKTKFLGPPAQGPDFSAVTTREDAMALVENRELEPMYLMPPEFGGPDVAFNIVYVPIGIAALKNDVDLNIIAPLIEKGSLSHYAANPEYRGDSFIPMAIHITASEPEAFSTNIAVWGEALERDDVTML